jgi:hypothetical protein
VRVGTVLVSMVSCGPSGQVDGALVGGDGASEPGIVAPLPQPTTVTSAAHAIAEGFMTGTSQQVKRQCTRRHLRRTSPENCGAPATGEAANCGRKRIEGTMIYVSYANAHRSPIAPEILTAVTGAMDPDQRVLGMLSARARVTIAEAERRGTQVASGPKRKRDAVELRVR